MDQKNEPANGVASPDATNVPTEPNEVSVDLSSLQAGNDGTPSAAPVSGDTFSPSAPAGDAAGDAPGQEAPTVAFTTDSAGNVQAISTPDAPEGPLVTPSDPNAPELPAVDSFEQPAAQDPSSVADVSGDAPAQAPDAPYAPVSDAQQPPVMGPVPAPDPNGMPQPPLSSDAAPAAAPVPVPHKDKKLFVILAGVAVILVGLIVAMMFI